MSTGHGNSFEELGVTQDHQETPRTAALTAEQEALFREGLRTAPTIDGSQSAGRDYTIAEWADRCRQLLATLDRDRAARQVTELRAALKHTLTHAQFRDCFLCVQSAALLAGDKAETPTYPADWRDMTPEQWDETAARARTEP